jgi:invasion protein IalB
MIRPVLLALGLAGLVMTGNTAMAQQKAAPAGKPASVAPVSSDPGTTSATYGDWVLRCQRVGDGDQAKKFCEVAQTIQSSNPQAMIAEIALGRVPDGSVHLTTLLPPSVSFPSTVQFVSGDKTHQATELQWRRCLSGGCYADTAATEEMIKAWRGATEAGRIAFKDAGGRDVAIPISFRGFAQALDALPKS